MATQHQPSPPRPNPALRQKLKHMSLTLAPLVQVTSGAIHPAFPRTLLAFWLLTDAQLDDLATFYHQRGPNPWATAYPLPVDFGGPDMVLERKRRRFGRFIGLGGCESPVGPGAWVDVGGSEEEFMAWVRRQLEDPRDQFRRQDLEDEIQAKIRWYR